MSVQTKEDIEDARGTRPSSPRRFFARLYGHLETREDKSKSEKRSSLAGKIISNNGTIDLFPTETSTGRTIDCEKVYQTDSEFHREQLSVSVSVSSSSKRINLPSSKNESLSLSVEEITKARLLMFREASASFLPVIYPHLPTAALVVPSAGQPTRLGYEKFPRSNNDIDGHLNGFSAFFARRRRRETRPRRQRTTFSGQQTARLEFEYRRGEYITRGRRFELAESLSLTETQIKIWFQNRRAKDKRIEKARLDQHYRFWARMVKSKALKYKCRLQLLIPTELRIDAGTEVFRLVLRGTELSQNIVVSNGLLPIPVYAGVTADLGDLSFCKDTKYTEDCHIVMPSDETICSASVTRENEESGGGDSITSSGSNGSGSSNSGSVGVAEDVS